jgi:hypothetical protein
MDEEEGGDYVFDEAIAMAEDYDWVQGQDDYDQTAAETHGAYEKEFR